jgi:hypothetical protein
VKKSMLLLVAVLILVAWTPAFAANGSIGEENICPVIEPCPNYTCAAFWTDCEGIGNGQVLWLDEGSECLYFSTIYTQWEGMCQEPPATFWDALCFQ